MKEATEFGYALAVTAKNKEQDFWNDTSGISPSLCIQQRKNKNSVHLFHNAAATTKWHTRLKKLQSSE